MIGSTGLVAAAFVANKNIYNSDNYRYLVYFLVPWASGFGLIVAGLRRRGLGGRVAGALLALAMGVLFTLDTLDWYRRFGWIEGVATPVRRPLEDPALDWLRDHPQIEAIFGGYWDVYRYAFLLNGRIVPVPYPDYPDRLDASDRFPGRQPRTLVARVGDLNNFYSDFAARDGAKLLFRGDRVLIYDWPRLR